MFYTAGSLAPLGIHLGVPLSQRRNYGSEETIHEALIMLFALAYLMAK